MRYHHHSYEEFQKKTKAFPRTAEDAVRRHEARGFRDTRKGTAVLEHPVLHAPSPVRRLPYADRRLVRAHAPQYRRRLREARPPERRTRDRCLDDRNSHPLGPPDVPLQAPLLIYLRRERLLHDHLLALLPPRFPLRPRRDFWIAIREASDSLAKTLLSAG